MLAAYGVDILDPAVSPRRVQVLLDHLPPAARRGGEAWAVEAELLAGLIDHVAYLTWVTMRAAGGKQGKPKPLKRPARPPRIGEQVNAARRRQAITAGEQGGPVKTASWAEAITHMAGSGGVRVRNG